MVKRKYSILNRDNNYKKRVTWFDCTPEIPVAVVDYIGTYPTNTVHGNAKNLNASYIRTTSEQKKVIREGLATKRLSREIRRDVNQIDPENSSDHPIMLGPMFLSWDRNEKTYQRFIW